MYFLSTLWCPRHTLCHNKIRTKCYWSVFLQPICYNHFPLYYITQSTVHHLQEQEGFYSTIFNRFLFVLSFQVLSETPLLSFSHSMVPILKISREFLSHAVKINRSIKVYFENPFPESVNVGLFFFSYLLLIKNCVTWHTVYNT